MLTCLMKQRKGAEGMKTNKKANTVLAGVMEALLSVFRLVQCYCKPRRWCPELEETEAHV